MQRRLQHPKLRGYSTKQVWLQKILFCKNLIVYIITQLLIALVWIVANCWADQLYTRIFGNRSVDVWWLLQSYEARGVIMTTFGYFWKVNTVNRREIRNWMSMPKLESNWAQLAQRGGWVAASQSSANGSVMPSSLYNEIVWIYIYILYLLLSVSWKHIKTIQFRLAFTKSVPPEQKLKPCQTFKVYPNNQIC